MKKRLVITGVLVGVLLGVASVMGMRYVASCRQYAEAEQLVALVWPMAHEVGRFTEEKGRMPTTLDELDRFSAEYDFSPVGMYPHRFIAEGEILFRVDVNRAYSFEID